VALVGQMGSRKTMDRALGAHQL